MRLDALVGTFLIGTHQARIAHHIGGEDRGQSTGASRGDHGSGGGNSAPNLSYFEPERGNFMRSQHLCLDRASPRAAAMAEDTANRPCRSLLRHSGLAQAGEISGFDQSADLLYPPIFRAPEASDARKAIVAEQLSGFGEFRGGAVGLAFEAVGRGEERASVVFSRIGVARFFEPIDSLVSTRLQKMYHAYPYIPIGDEGIAGVEANCLLCKRDDLINRPGQEFAPA